MHNNLFIFNSKLKKYMSVIIILLVFLILFGETCRILRFKYGDGIYVLDQFYTLEKDSVDVLVLGSSHAFEDINPAVLYEEDGIASYVLGGSAQPMWNTYYYLKEALKTQTPELIVLEAFCTTYDDYYSDDSRIIKNNYGLRWSLNKIESIRTSIPNENIFEFFPEFLQYHNRYEDLSQADFLPYRGYGNGYADWKGHGDNFLQESFSKPQLKELEEGVELNPKVEQYYRKILELANQEKIPILVVVSPYAGIDEEEQKELFTAGKIAAEYNVNFLDFNYLYDDLDMDFSTDCADYAHLNNFGNEKLSKYISNYIKKHYNVSDRRNDERYASWRRNVEWRKQTVKNENLKMIKNYEEYVSFLQEQSNISNYYIICTKKDNKEQQLKCFAYFEDDKIYDHKEVNAEWTYYLNKWNALKLDGTQSIYINGTDYKQVDIGCNIVVFDSLTEQIIDAVGINEKNELIR